MRNKPIFVTQPSLPSLVEFNSLLETIWETKILTNNGPFHQELESKLADYLGVKYISVFSNGTLALMTALQTLSIKGEVITTPYSFVATANSLIWNNLTPVFCDTDSLSGNIDAHKIEALITDKTAAIMPVHVYGFPCEVEKIQEIANKHKLKVIYDAAHAFGVRFNGQSILNYGDLSVLSFHATKVFNTIEGGAIVCHDVDTKTRVDNLKNFGITDEVTVVEPGINAKMNELQAAFGLLQLESIDDNIIKRKKIFDLYNQELIQVRGVRLPIENAKVRYNYSYFPIFVTSEFKVTRDELYERLKIYNIYTRRYFYPLITEFDPYKMMNIDTSKINEAKIISEQVLCLPIFSDMKEEDVLYIVGKLKEI